MSHRRVPLVNVEQWLVRVAPAIAEAPDATWLASLRAEFVREEPSARRRTAWPARMRGAAIAALAAAAVWIAVLALQPGPGWELVSSGGVGTLQLGPLGLEAGQRAAIAGALRDGATVDVPAGAQLDLVLPGIAFLQIPGGTRATLARLPGKWLRRDLEVSLDHGELRFTTGPEFHGRRLVVRTPEARATVTGTTLAVLRGTDTTCVCVFEGRVAVAGSGFADTVLAGTRRTLFATGAPSRLEPIRGMETMKLGMLRDRADSTMARTTR